MNSPPPAPSAPPELDAQASADPDRDAIDERLRRTMRAVKWVDLATSLMVLLASVVGYLLLLTVIDHWLLGLSFQIRLAGLALLVGLSGAYLIARILPLLLHRINPLYAARAIEQSEPQLKNGLLNYWLLRNAPAQRVHAAILSGMRQQAAHGLSEVHWESVVNRRPLIRAGYVLAALVIVTLLYQVFSPIDPLPSVARLLAPWADIQRPSRVLIDHVSPGDTSIYRGQSLAVTCQVFGLQEGDPLELEFRSSDGEFAGQRLQLEPTSVAAQYRAAVDPNGRGIEHTLWYRIHAGDATTREYQVTVEDIPILDVDRVHYQFPAYTGEPDRELSDGNIRAVEGTRVRIEAVANHDIRTAYAELYSDQSSGVPRSDAPDGDSAPLRAAADPSRGAPVRVPIASHGRRVALEFMLRMNAEHNGSRYHRYALRYVDDEGQLNRDPVIYQIETLADLAPVLEVLAPASQSLDTPANQALRFKLRAFDPDYRLQRLDIVVRREGAEPVREVIWEAPDVAGHPSEDLDLSTSTETVLLEHPWVAAAGNVPPGETVELWLEARDNRHDPDRSQWSPNVTRSASYRVRVLPPVQPPDSRPEPDESQGEPPSGADSGGDEANRSDAENASDGGVAGGQTSSDTGDSAEGDSSGDAAGEATPTDQDREGSQPGQSQGTAASGQNNDSSDPSRSADRSPAAAPQRTGEPEDGQQPNNSSGDSGAGSADQPQPQPQPQPGETRDAPAADGQGETGSGGQPQRGTQQPGNSDSRRPLADDGSEDAEAFDRLLEALREQNAQDEGQRDTDDPQQKSGGAAERASPGESRATPAGEESPDQRDNDSGGSTTSRGKDRQTGQDSANPTPEQSDRQAGSNAEPEPATPTEPAGDSADSESSPAGAPTSPQTGPSSAAQDDPQITESPSGEDSDETRSPTDGAEGESASSPGSPSDDPPGNADRQRQPSAADQQTSREPGATGRNQPDEAMPSGASSDDGRPASQAQASGSDADPQSAAPQPGTPGPRPGATESSPQDSQDEANSQRSGDKANLQYAREATDLVLERLSEGEMSNQKLLDELGWTEEQLQRFMQRWQKLRQAAGQDSPDNNGRRQWEDALRSLGLRPTESGTETSAVPNRAASGVEDSGRRSRPPTEYLDRYRLYQRNTSRGR